MTDDEAIDYLKRHYGKKIRKHFINTRSEGYESLKEEIDKTIEEVYQWGKASQTDHTTT